jgi:hypothetical protein
VVRTLNQFFLLSPNFENGEVGQSEEKEEGLTDVVCGEAATSDSETEAAISRLRVAMTA